MRWTPELDRGAWIGPRLHGWGRVGGVVPHGFAAYARILNPFDATQLTSHEEWTWTHLAGRTGRILHPLAQAANLLGSHGQAPVDGWQVGLPIQGFLDPSLLAALVPSLIAATSRSDDLTLGVCDGWGELHPANVTVFGWDEGGPLKGARLRAATAEARRQQRRAVDPDVARATNRGRSGRPTRFVLQLPGRDYVLLTGSLSELADPTWPRRAGMGWQEGLTGPMPQLIWPADHAWCVGSEIDFDSTLVAGSRELVDAILAVPGLEAFEVPEEGDLTTAGDRLNPSPVSDWRGSTTQGS